MNRRLSPRAPSATYMLQGIHMHIATHILNKILKYVCVGILHIQLDLYTERNLLFNIISLPHTTACPGGGGPRGHLQFPPPPDKLKSKKKKKKKTLSDFGSPLLRIPGHAPAT